MKLRFSVQLQCNHNTGRSPSINHTAPHSLTFQKLDSSFSFSFFACRYQFTLLENEMYSTDAVIKNVCYWCWMYSVLHKLAKTDSFHTFRPMNVQGIFRQSWLLDMDFISQTILTWLKVTFGQCTKVVCNDPTSLNSKLHIT